MSQPSSRPFELVRKMLPYTTVAACLALIYMAWVFYSRSSQNRELQKQADQKYTEEAQKTYEMYGSGQLKIMLFYAVPAVVPRGGPGQLCYSVANATHVKIDHGVEEIKPSLSHCVAIQPVKSTVYTLSAEDEKGNHSVKSLNVVVR